jgi:hypothetical protein
MIVTHEPVKMKELINKTNLQRAFSVPFGRKVLVSLRSFGPRTLKLSLNGIHLRTDRAHSS